MWLPCVQIIVSWFLHNIQRREALHDLKNQLLLHVTQLMRIACRETSVQRFQCSITHENLLRVLFSGEVHYRVEHLLTSNGGAKNWDARQRFVGQHVDAVG